MMYRGRCCCHVRAANGMRGGPAHALRVLSAARARSPDISEDVSDSGYEVKFTAKEASDARCGHPVESMARR